MKLRERRPKPTRGLSSWITLRGPRGFGQIPVVAELILRDERRGEVRESYLVQSEGLT